MNPKAFEKFSQLTTGKLSRNDMAAIYEVHQLMKLAKNDPDNNEKFLAEAYAVIDAWYEARMKRIYRIRQPEAGQ